MSHGLHARGFGKSSESTLYSMKFNIKMKNSGMLMDLHP